MDIEITKEEICDILIQTILIQECRDSHIRDNLLDKYEDQPCYGVLVEAFDAISCTYFKLGFNIHDLITSQPTTALKQ